ncbi:MAG: flavodoxin domain-containing protein [Atribacterota bacterium]
MNIGIIIYSQTGNTNSVALKLKEKLSAAGHSVGIERIEISGELGPGATNFQLKTRPDVDTYDALVFGAPVQAFSLSPAMKSYLTQIASLKGKKAACFITKYLPFHWTGGNQAINKMKKICESKDGTVCGSGIVIWSSAHREKKITDVVEKLSRLF